MKEMKMGVFTYNEESRNFNFKTSLSAYDKQLFVQTVVDNLIGEGVYNVILRDLIFDFVIVEIFTNIDTSFINMKDEDGNDVNQIIPIEHFLEQSNVVEVVKANIEDGLLEELNRAIDLNIQFLTGIQPNSLYDAFANLLSTLEKKIGEIDLSSAMEMIEKFSNMTDEFNVDNIVKAYMNSDVHEKNEEEIAKAKKKKVKTAKNIENAIESVDKDNKE